jgi:hypothetical protein
MVLLYGRAGRFKQPEMVVLGPAEDAGAERAPALLTFLGGDPGPPARPKPKRRMRSTARRRQAGSTTLSYGEDKAIGLGCIVLPRFVRPLPHFTPHSLTYSVPLYLKRRCDRALRRHPCVREAGAVGEGAPALGGARGGVHGRQALPPPAVQPFPRAPVYSIEREPQRK